MVLPSVLQCFRPIEVVSRDSHPQQAAVSSHPALALARTVVKHDRSPSERKPGHKARWQLPTGRRADSQWRPIFDQLAAPAWDILRAGWEVFREAFPPAW